MKHHNHLRHGFLSSIGKTKKITVFVVAILAIASQELVSAFSPPIRSSSHPVSAVRGSTTISPFYPQLDPLAPATASKTTSSALGLFQKWGFGVDDAFSDDAVKLGAGLAALAVAINCLIVVDAGTVGIASTFGTLDRYDPGLHLRNPVITKVDVISTKTQLLEQSNYVPTKEGLTVELDTAVLIRMDPDSAVELYRSVGPDFYRKLVAPESSSSVRGLTSESEAKALYTAGRSELQNKMKAELTEKLTPRGLVVEDVLLKNVVLPEALSESIQEKARAEQESARMEFVLLKESQEAQRKAIEAQGIAQFQDIVSKGITPSLLKWKGIEATEKLAESPNAKVVIMGNSKDSLPVILGSDANGK